METALNAIQKTPVPTILILAGLLFLLLGFVTKIGGIIKVSPEQKRWTIPIGLTVLAIGLVLYFIPARGSNTGPISASDWEGSWNLQWEYEGQWYKRTMTVRSDQFGIEGSYEIGKLTGKYVNGDVSKVTGETENTAGTGVTCPSGKQTGLFSFNLTNGGKRMVGWWNVCGQGTRYEWKADKLD